MAKGRRRKAVRWIAGHAYLLGKTGFPADRAVCGLPLGPDGPGGQCQNCKRGLDLTW